MDSSQRAMLGDKIKGEFEAEAKARQGTRTDIQANLPECRIGQARDQAAEVVNVSPRLVESASKVRKEGTPALASIESSGGRQKKSARPVINPVRRPEYLW
jgi:hypothetical protein